MLEGPVIETDRLILRPPAAQDFDGWAHMHEDGDAMKFIGGAMHPAQVWRVMATMIGHWHIRGYGMFSWIEKETGQWIGRGGPWNPHGWPQAEIGWGLMSSRMGKGYALEAATASIEFAVDQLGWTDIVHCIDRNNVSSIKLAERLGSSFRTEIDPPKPYTGEKWVMYGQTAKIWRAAR